MGRSTWRFGAWIAVMAGFGCTERASSLELPGGGDNAESASTDATDAPPTEPDGDGDECGLLRCTPPEDDGDDDCGRLRCTPPDDDWDDDCGSFLGCEDEGDEPTLPLCDVWDPDGCPSGEKCTILRAHESPWFSDVNVCVPAGPQPVGSPCTHDVDGPAGTDTCDATSFCFTTARNSDGEGFCVPFCQLPEAAPYCPDGIGPYPQCWKDNSGGIINLCFGGCDPHQVGSCPDGQTCTLGVNPVSGPWYVLGPVCLPDARGGGTQGETCTSVFDCVEGLSCLKAEDYGPGCTAEVGCCTAFCSLAEGDANCLEDGHTCIPLYGAYSQPPFDDYGYCGLAP